MNSFTFNSNRERSFPKQFSDHFPTARAASVGCLKVPRHVAPTLHGTDGPDIVADKAVAPNAEAQMRPASQPSLTAPPAGHRLARRDASAPLLDDARLPAGHRRSLAPPPRRLRRGPAQLPACRASAASATGTRCSRQTRRPSPASTSPSPRCAGRLPTGATATTPDRPPLLLTAASNRPSGVSGCCNR